VFAGQTVNLIIPALNEEAALPGVLAGVDRGVIDRVIVADNGSSDRTAEVARDAGASVFVEPRRGYGSACLRAVLDGPPSDLLVFMDGDGSDDPTDIPELLSPLVDGQADLVIGSRVLGAAAVGALTPVQRFGNALTCTLVRMFWGASYTDLGPMRALRRDTFDSLQMCDPDFGWTIEMQVKAAQRRLQVVEVPVRCHLRQAGRSKVSGTVMGSFRAGKRILGYVLVAKGRELRTRRPGGRAPVAHGRMVDRK
jgi:glycosyltransferase involved in cell wall biosynthesis